MGMSGFLTEFDTDSSTFTISQRNSALISFSLPLFCNFSLKAENRTQLILFISTIFLDKVIYHYLPAHKSFSDDILDSSAFKFVKTFEANKAQNT
jgi:hypothetical protein